MYEEQEQTQEEMVYDLINNTSIDDEEIIGILMQVFIVESGSLQNLCLYYAMKASIMDAKQKDFDKSTDIPFREEIVEYILQEGISDVDYTIQYIKDEIKQGRDIKINRAILEKMKIIGYNVEDDMKRAPPKQTRKRKAESKKLSNSDQLSIRQLNALFGSDENLRITKGNVNFVGKYKVINGNQVKNQCFSMSIRDGRMYIGAIKYPNEYQCKLPGTVILQNLIQFAKDNGLEVIELIDASRIYNSDNTQSFSLSIYNYLLKGDSWYGRYGFKTIDSQDIQFPMIIDFLRTTPIRDLILKKPMDEYLDQLNENNVLKKMSEENWVAKSERDFRGIEAELNSKGFRINRNTTIVDILEFLSRGRDREANFDTIKKIVDLIENHFGIRFIQSRTMILQLRRRRSNTNKGGRRSYRKKPMSYSKK